jgi:predicted glycosyltransferase
MEDVPNNKYGVLLPNRRESVKDKCHFVGYILSFDRESLTNKDKIREELDYSKDPLIICSVGGTSLGKPLLKLLCKTYPLIKEKMQNLKLVLVAGPNISPDSLNIPEGIILRDYLPKQYKHFAVCDLAIVQGGSNTTLELVALNKPFIYFPLEEHFEQQLYVAPRLERLKAGIKMQFSQTTPDTLAEIIIQNIGMKVNYPSFPIEGAKKTVKIIKKIIEE